MHPYHTFAFHPFVLPEKSSFMDGKLGRCGFLIVSFRFVQGPARQMTCFGRVLYS